MDGLTSGAVDGQRAGIFERSDVTDFTQADYDATVSKFAPGTSWRNRQLGKSSQTDLFHIRGLVDDQIVYRMWFYTRQRWEYQLATVFEFWYIDTALDGIKEA